jgi:uncharacterized protein YlaI
MHISPKTEFKKGQTPHNWKGDNVGYFALHGWLTRNFGKPSVCSFCGSVRCVQWANKTGKYLRNPQDWLQLCRKCHHKFDNITEKARLTRENKKIGASICLRA